MFEDVIARAADPCGDGRHDDYDVTILRHGAAGSGTTAITVVCSRCGAPRLEDFAFRGAVLEMPPHGVCGTEVTIENRTGRDVVVYVDGHRFELTADNGGTYTHVVGSADDPLPVPRRG